MSFKASMTALTHSQPSVKKEHPGDKIVQDRRAQAAPFPPTVDSRLFLKKEPNMYTITRVSNQKASEISA